MVSQIGRGRHCSGALRGKSRFMGAFGDKMGKTGVFGIYCRAWCRRDSRRKLAKAAWDDFGYFIRSKGAVWVMINKTLGIAGLFFIAGLGAALGGWIVNQQDPVQFFSRKVLTPVVKPGDAVKVELDNYRVLRCAQRTYRVLTKPDGERSVQVPDRPASFGKLGRDKYITSIETPPDAPFGKAIIYSYTERMCNPWEYLKPVVYGEWTDNIEFGPQTKRISPEEAENTLLQK